MKKKLIIFSLIITFGSCSEDDEVSKCTEEVWGMEKFESSSNSYYKIEYGPSEYETVIVDVDKKTYDYYLAIVEDDEELDCWEGLK